MRRRVDVLPRDQAVPDREDVDAVPLELRPSFSTVSVHSQTAKSSPACMLRVRNACPGCSEDRRDVLAHRVGALGRSPAVWLSKTISGWWSAWIVVEILRVPRVVVALDQLCDSRRSSRDCPTSAQHALVADAAGEAVGVEALEQELRRLASDAEEVAEARERDPPGRLALGDERRRACS